MTRIKNLYEKMWEISLMKKLYEGRWGFFFILPLYAFFIVFTLYPLFAGLSYSFYDVGLGDKTWVGLANFEEMFETEVFWIALRNTILMVMIVVPIDVIVSLFVSVIAFSLRQWFQTFIRVSFYLPVVATSVVVSMVWLWMLNPSYGLINYVLGLFGIGSIDFLGLPTPALLSVMAVLVTFTIGQPVILYLAALGGISPDLYESAMIDGATAWKRFIKITLPLLKPTTLFVVITQVIATFQVFVVIMLLTDGGPANATQTIVFRMYQTAFDNFQFGFASALGMVLIIVVGLFTIILFKLFGKGVDI